jgi:hypothetical protein
VLAVPEEWGNKAKKVISLCEPSLQRLHLVTRRAHWVAFQLAPDHPLAVFTETGLVTRVVVFIRNSALWTSALELYNITNPEELAHFLSHLVWVGATISSHAAGIPQMDIKFALHWKSNAFYTYLWNLWCQAARTHAAVRDFNPNVFSLMPSHTVG